MDANSAFVASRAAEDAKLTAIWRWPGIRAESKRAWECLYRIAGAPRSGGRGEALAKLSVATALVGNDQGTSHGGPRYLTTLANEGLIQVVDRDKKRGIWTVYLLDPLDVARARRACGGDSGQYSFLDDPDADAEQAGPQNEYPSAIELHSAGASVVPPVAVLLAEPRRRADTDRRTEQAHAHRTAQTSKTDKTLSSWGAPAQEIDRGSASRTATGDDEPAGELALAAENEAARVALAIVAACRGHDVRWLAGQVGKVVSLRFLPPRELQRMLDQLRVKRPANPPGYLRRQVEIKLYELGVRDASLAELGIELHAVRVK